MAQYQGPKEAFPVKQQMQLSVFIVSSFLDLRIAFFIFGFAVIAVQLVGEALLVFPVQPRQEDDKQQGGCPDQCNPLPGHIEVFAAKLQFRSLLTGKILQ
jgi:hypothetical protein